MKKTLFISCLVALSLCPKALRASEVVHFADKEGKTISFLLSDHPAVSFDDENVIITTDVAKVFYPLSAYSKFSMEAETETSISTAKSAGPVFSFAEGMRAEGLKPGARVTIYSANGQKLAQGTADSEGRLSIEVDVVKGNVYIIRTASASFKLIK